MRLSILLFFFSFSLITFSQEIKETNTDILLQQGLEQYRQGNFSEALKYANRGLQLAPEYHDIRLLRIRAHQALENPEKARADLDSLYLTAPNYPEVKDLGLRQAQLLNSSEAILYLDRLSEVYNDAEIQILKAQILIEQGQVKEGRRLAENLLKQGDLTNEQRLRLNQILKLSLNNELGLTYQLFNFSEDYNRDSWHNYMLEYQQNIGKTVLVGRVTHSDRGFDSGQLYEIDFYPIVNENLYFFGNIGYSNDELFPEFRASSSAFFSVFKAFELEAGARWMRLNDSDYFTGIGGITYYAGKFYFNLRSAVGPKRLNNTIENHQLNVRYYYSGTDNFLFTRLSRGISPDESTLFAQVQDNPALDAYFAGGGINFLLGSHHILRAEAGVLFEEITANRDGTQAILSAGYRYRF